MTAELVCIPKPEPELVTLTEVWIGANLAAGEFEAVCYTFGPDGPLLNVQDYDRPPFAIVESIGQELSSL